MCVALENFPDGLSPQYLHDLLSACPVASPGLYQEASGLMDEQSKLHSKAKKGEFLFRGLPATAFIEKSHTSTWLIELLVLSIFL